MKPLHPPLLPAGLVLLVLGFTVACSTPRTRIRDNQAAFDSYPPEVQTLIEAGRIAMGFTPEQVVMALGRPERTATRTTADGDRADIWIYLGYRTVNETATVYGRGAYGRTRDPAWVDMQRREEYDRTRVEFAGGRVVSIEERTR